MRSVQRVLFTHNGPLYRGPDGTLYGVHITNAVKQRYLQLGTHVTFLMREAHLSEPTERFSPISGSDFDFRPFPNLLSIKGQLLGFRKANELAKTAVESADVVVARVPSITSRLAIKWARRLGRPYLVECVACNWDALWNHGLKAKLTAPYYFWMQKRVVWESPYVIYVTEEFLQRRYPTRGKHTAISNVDLGQTPESVLASRLQRIRLRGREPRPMRLATIANVEVPYKSQADVIAVLPTLAAAGVDIEYHLIGAGNPGHLRSVAQRYGVEVRVIFHGARRHAEVFTLLDGMDAYVQPSRQEGLPRALIEAMSRGLPCAGARTGGIPELLPKHRIFSPGSPVEATAALRSMLRETEMAGDARRNFARAADFERETLERRRARFFREFLSDHHLANWSIDT